MWSVNYKEVADKGWFVYCYLRVSNWTPYYIGISSTAHRPTAKNHTCVVPKNPVRIRMMRSGLTEEEAKEWEMFYIAHYGRKDIGTGILRNLTDGGEGRTGGPDMIRAAAKYGFEFNEWQAFSPTRRAAIAARWKAGERGDALRTDENILDFKAAEKLGISLERLHALSEEERALAHQRFGNGVRGEELFAPPVEPEQRGALSGEVRANDAAEKYGVTRAEFDSWSQERKCVVATRYAAGHRGASLLDEDDRNDSRLEAAAREIGLDPELWRKLTRTERIRIKERYRAGARGEELLKDKVITYSAEGAAEKLGYSLEAWNELTPRQKKQEAENHRQSEIYAEQWGVDARLVRLMPDRLRNQFKRHVDTALAKGVCPLIWFSLEQKVRCRIDARFRRGVRGLELLQGC